MALSQEIAAVATVEIQNRIKGKTPGATSQNLYSTRDNSTPSYVRSSTWFGKDIDLTGVAAWSSDGVKVCTLIAPDIAITAAHYGLGATNTVRFVAKDGTITTLTVASVATVFDSVASANTDIQVIKFTSSAPATIKPLPILNQTNLNSAVLALVLWIDQNQIGYTAQFDFFSLANHNFLDIEVPNFTGLPGFVNPANDHAATFAKIPIVGDSGHPVIMLLNGQAILLGTFETSDGIPSVGGVESNGDITTAIAGLGSASRPTFFDVTSPKTYPSTNLTELLQVIASGIATNSGGTKYQSMNRTELLQITAAAINSKSGGIKYPSSNRTELYQIIAGNFA